MRQTKKYELFFNPAGFIELHYTGAQTSDSVISASNQLFKKSAKLKSKKEPALILVDVTNVPLTNNHTKMAPARKEAVRAISSDDYDRLAVYGSVTVQVVMNTIILIAGKRDKVRVFANREDAVKWLKSGS
jgi:hypothetical protein